MSYNQLLIDSTYTGTHFYLCDPEKNHYCRKTQCYRKGGLCAYTTKKQFSIDGHMLFEGQGWGAPSKDQLKKGGMNA